MSEARSRHFNGFQLRTFERLGDLYLPAYDRMPSFSQSGCLEHIDILIDEIHPEDKMGLSLLLYVLRFCPTFLLEKLVNMMNHHDRYPALVAALLRLLNLALKGVVMSLYYSGMTGHNYAGPKPFDVMEYSLHCEPDEAPQACEGHAH